MSAAIDGYKQVRRDRQGKRWGAKVALSVKKLIDCTERSLKNSDEQIEGLRLKMGGQANKGNFVAGVYYRLPNQGDPVGEAQLQKTSCS